MPSDSGTQRKKPTSERPAMPAGSGSRGKKPRVGGVAPEDTPLRMKMYSIVAKLQATVEVLLGVKGPYCSSLDTFAKVAQAAEACAKEMLAAGVTPDDCEAQINEIGLPRLGVKDEDAFEEEIMKVLTDLKKNEADELVLPIGGRMEMVLESADDTSGGSDAYKAAKAANLIKKATVACMVEQEYDIYSAAPEPAAGDDSLASNIRDIGYGRVKPKGAPKFMEQLNHRYWAHDDTEISEDDLCVMVVRFQNTYED